MHNETKAGLATVRNVLSFIALGALIATFFALLVLGLRAIPEPVAARALRADAALDVGTVDAESDAATDVTQGWLEPQMQAGDFVALLDGEPVEATFIVGAPGVYPPLNVRAKGIDLPSPAASMSGEVPNSVEVYASSGSSAAFWGEVSTDENAVELDEAAELAVRVSTSGGVPLPSANVRIARETVGLVVLDQTADSDGTANFNAIPPGRYWVSADAPGFASASIEVDSRDGSASLVLADAVSVTGTVKGPDGDPIAGAIVAIHAGTGGADPLANVPIDVVESDMLGEFRVQVAGDRFAAVGRLDGYAASASAVVEPRTGSPARLEITMRPARTLAVQVVNTSGDSVQRALVQWEDEPTGSGDTRMTDAQGRVNFAGVPVTAAVQARLDRFQSNVVELRSLPERQRTLELTLDVEDKRFWRYRLQVPDGVDVQQLQVTDSAGAACSVETEVGRDWTFRGCGEGDMYLRATTNLGAVEVDTGAFHDGATVTLPEPSQLRVQIDGAADERWEATMFSLNSAGRPAPFELEETSSTRRVLLARVYPGRWILTVGNRRIGTQQFPISVDSEEVTHTIELAQLERFQVWAVDSYGSPITGAYVMLFDSAKLVDVARSAGQLPSEFRVRPPFEGRVLVVDPRRGEGTYAVSTARDERSLRVEIDETVLQNDVPPSRPSRSEMEAILGAGLVARDSAWVVDFQSDDAPGLAAGLRRGDWIVTAWSERGKYRVIVFRSGTGYLDVPVR